MIEGKIGTREPLKIYVTHLNKVDSITTQNGTFKFSLNVSSPQLIRVVAAVANNMRINASRSFFTSNGVIHIEAKSIDDYRQIHITSSDTISENMYHSFRARFDPLVQVARTYIDRSYDSGRTESEQKLLGDLYAHINQIEREVAIKFVYEHTNDAVGAYVFNYFLQEEKNAAKLDSIYNLFDPNLHTSFDLIEMRKKNDHMKKLAIGKPAPLFSAITSTHQTLRSTASNLF